MTLLQAIIDLLNKLVGVIAPFIKPKATEQSVEDGAAQIDGQISKEQSSGRPQ